MICTISISNIIVAAGLFTLITFVLVVGLLVARKLLVKSGNVNIDVNQGYKEIEAPAGGSISL